MTQPPACSSRSASDRPPASPQDLVLWRAVFFCCTAILWCSTMLSAWGVDPNQVNVTASSGIAGVWKIGFPTAHRLTISSTPALRGNVEIQTFDGDGVPVRYRDDAWIFECSDGQPAVVEVVAKHGRGNRPIRILVMDDQKQVLVDRLLTEEERGKPLPAHQPWLVGLGSAEMNLGQGAMTSASGELIEFSVCEVSDIRDLPRTAAAYSGVDAVLFSSANASMNSNWHADQRRALVQWLREGGQLVLTWGAGGPELTRYEEFQGILPGTLQGTANECDPGPIESLLGSQDQLSPLRCSLLQMSRGKIDVVTVTSSRTKLPFVARWAYGLGTVVWMATEIDSEEISQWNTRPGLLKYLMKDLWEKPEGRVTKQSFQAYDDLAGQLNATLDTFPDLRLGNLGHLVLIAGIFALLIGPLDYFVISRAWKMPRWTWWTLMMASLGTMLTTAFLTRAWKPELPSINQLEIIDVDDQTQVLHGRGFVHAYSGRRGLYDFESHHRSFSMGNTSLNKPTPSRMDWFGQPGKGLGGFDSNVTTQLGLPVYSIPGQTDGSSDMAGLGFPASGTKAMQTEWTETISIPKGSNGLGTVSGKDDLLQGTFANPLGVELEGGVLYFAGRAYTIPSRIRPGERVAISTSVPKDIARRLQRRAFVAGEEQGVEWDSADTKSVERLAELLSFHRSAGGPSYTGLFHRYLSVLESSDLLKLDRAVLFAQIAEPASTWTLRRNGIPIELVGGKSRTMVRIVFSVENNSKSSSMFRDEIPPNP